uniref:Uncharacterized protein n=1 Tax=Anopheles maculatus TaxID=74869 RepID=A0A182SNJ5_9DIPT
NSSSPLSTSLANEEDQVANVTIIQVSNSNNGTTPSPTITTASSPKPPVSRFNFPKAKPSIVTPTTVPTGVSTIITDDVGPGSDHNYKSNVQIIPSNIEYAANEDQLMQPSIIASINEQQITTVTVPNNVQSVPISSSVMATPRSQPPTVQVAVATSSTPIKGPESNFGTVTQIAVNSSTVAGDVSGVSKPIHCQSSSSQSSQHYEQVFLTSTVQVTAGGGQTNAPNFEDQAVVSVAPIVSKATAGNKSSKVLLLSRQSRSSSHSDIPLPARLAIKGNRTNEVGGSSNDKENRVQHDTIIGSNGSSIGGTASTSKQGTAPSAGNTPAPIHLTGGSPSKRPAVDRNIYTPHPQRAAPLLQRGLTELVLSTRPSASTAAVNGTDQAPIIARGRRAPVENKIRSDHLPPEQRRRSSSTSDARQEHTQARLNGAS